jgi:predicted component of type VI protein secretion system
MNRFDSAHESAPRFALRLLNPPRPDALPRGFVPLQLILLPSNTSIELNHPEILVGRHSSSDLRLASGEVSRCHCRFLFQAHCWWIKDSSSLNGIFVNNKRVKATALRPGDVIRIADFTFVVHHSNSTASIEADESAYRSIAAILAPPKPQRKAS